MAQEIQNKLVVLPESQQLYADVCHIIDETRTRVAVYVNAEVCMTNWRIGTRIKEDVLYNKRAEYGKQVVKTLAAKLTERYGKGWSEKTLRHCLRAAETFSGNTEHIEYLMLDDDSSIKVAQYYTQLPDKRVLAEKLQRAISIAREHYSEDNKNNSSLKI